MLPDGRRIGAHLPLGAGMVRAVERAHQIGLDTLQVFSDNPTAWRRRTEPATELPAFRARLNELGMGPIAIHAAYLVNLAGPDDDFYERSCNVLLSELRVAPGFAARYVNAHIGSHRGSGSAVGIERLAGGIARVFGEVDDTPDGARLVLENSAGSGDGLGSRLEELAAILEAIERRAVPAHRVGICLDTAHLWGAGVAISQPAEVSRLADRFDELIGLDRLAMIHFNDSKVALGSRADRHEHLGAGSIGEAGLAAILLEPRFAGVTYYLETPGMEQGYDAINAARAYDLAAGRPLAALPEGALELAGSRSAVAPGAGAKARAASRAGEPAPKATRATPGGVKAAASTKSAASAKSARTARSARTAKAAKAASGGAKAASRPTKNRLLPAPPDALRRTLPEPRADT